MNWISEKIKYPNRALIAVDELASDLQKSVHVTFIANVLYLCSSLC